MLVILLRIASVSKLITAAAIMNSVNRADYQRTQTFSVGGALICLSSKIYGTPDKGYYC